MASLNQNYLICYYCQNTVFCPPEWKHKTRIEYGVFCPPEYMLRILGRILRILSFGRIQQNTTNNTEDTMYSPRTSDPRIPYSPHPPPERVQNPCTFLLRQEYTRNQRNTVQLLFRTPFKGEPTEYCWEYENSPSEYEQEYTADRIQSRGTEYR